MKKIYILILLVTTVVVAMNARLTWDDGDEARYVVLAQALSAGSGQTDVHLPDPVPEWLTPPLYPWLLSRIMLMTDSLLALRLFSVMCYLAYAFLVAHFFVHVANFRSPIAIAASLTSLLGVFVLGFTWNIFSETIYLLLGLGSLLLCLRSERNVGVLCAGLLAGLCVLIRPVGLVLIPAGVLHYACRKRWSSVAVFAFAALAINLPTVLRTYDLLGVPVAYMAHYQDGSDAASVGGVPILDTMMTAAKSLPHYFFNSLPRRMFFSLFDERCLLCVLHLKPLIPAIMASIGVLILLGFVAKLRKATIIEWYWMGYWVLISTYNQPDYAARGLFLYQDRYLLTLIPFAVWYLFEGVRTVVFALPVTDMARNRLFRTAVFGCAVYVFLAGVGAGIVRMRNEVRMYGLASWDPQRYQIIGTEHDRAWGRYIEAGQWINDNTSLETVVACRKSRHMYLFSQRKAFRYDGAESSVGDAWQAISDQHRFGDVLIVEDAFPEDSGYGRDRIDTLEPLIKKHADKLELLHETPYPVTRVWAVRSFGTESMETGLQ